MWFSGNAGVKQDASVYYYASVYISNLNFFITFREKSSHTLCDNESKIEGPNIFYKKPNFFFQNSFENADFII